MRFLFIFAAFLSSTLLFLVEPMAAKMILPTFGGAPAVWNTSLLFFQAVLLFGYGYAHWGSVKLPPRAQAIAHLLIFFVAAIVLPISNHSSWFHMVRNWAAEDKPPVPLIFLALAGLIGLPFFALSANSSTLQKWYASTDQPDAKQPYFLYSAGNVGSMLALLAYPTIIEPRLTLGEQGKLWAVGYAILVALLAGCAWIGTRIPSVVTEEVVEEAIPARPTRNDRIKWLLLAAVPSSLLLGVTSYLTSNIAPIPLLWVVPLALYLLTFILVFARRPIAPARLLARIYPLILTPLMVVILLESSSPQLGAFHLAVFFVAAWMCHSLLAQDKPHPAYLTEFFFYVSLGGVVGGIFNAIIAPLVFNTFYEYPAALVVAALLAPKTFVKIKKPLFDYGYPAIVAVVVLVIDVAVQKSGMAPTPTRTLLTMGLPAILCFLSVDSPTRFGLSVAATLIVSSLLHISSDGSVALTERSFFGVHRIVIDENGKRHKLTNGNTIHGIENFDHIDTPLTYYYPDGPIGQVMNALHPETAAFVGLGVGSLAAYGRPADQYTYYEIDPVVRKIASDPKYFTFLKDSKANVDIRMGDARLELENANSTYSLIVLDAFSSDAIPVHLLTVEAIQMYLNRLKPGGVLAFHVSNRYLDLKPILGAACQKLGLIGYTETDGASPDEEALGKTQSEWVIMAHAKSDFKTLKVSWWDEFDPTTIRPWTDDYSNVLSTFKPND